MRQIPIALNIVRHRIAMLTKLKHELEQSKTFLTFGFLQALGYVVAMLIPLVVAKLFSEELFGRYSLGEMIVYFFVTLFVISVRVPFIVYANQERGETRNIRKSFSIQSAFLAAGFLLFSIVCLSFKKFLMELAKIDSHQLFAVALAFFAMSLKDFISSMFMAINERIKSALVEISFGVITLIAIGVFYWAGSVNLQSVFMSYFISSLVVFFAYIWLLDFKLLLPPLFDRHYLSQMLNFTLWTAFGVVAVYLINWGGVAILRKYASLEDAGVFNLAYKFLKGFFALIYLIPNYFLPHISENITNPDKIRFYLYHKRPKIFLLGIVCFAAAYFVIPYFINFVYGNKFQGIVPVTRVMLLAVVCFLHTAFYAPLIGALKKFKFWQLANITQVALNIALNLILIPRFGIYGAAAATIAAYFYLMIATEIYFRLKMKKMLMPE